VSEPIDLGDGVTLRFTFWAPDRALNPQYDGIPDVERYGAIIDHPNLKTGETCSAAITFAGDVQKRIAPNATTWDVQSWDPLTLSPSLLCRQCGDHGFIRSGRWVRA